MKGTRSHVTEASTASLQHIRKPQGVTIRAFVTCMGLLNDYLAYLPTVNDSSKAVTNTKKGNVRFDEADLARIVLKAVPT